MRTFPRYSTDIPINIVGDGVAPELNRQLYNVSYGGLACHSDEPFKLGNLVTVRISKVDPPFEVEGIVVWCDPLEEGGYEVAIQFNEGRAAFSARMVAQICQIENYKKEILESEGRELSGDEAALEWVTKNAHKQNVQERAYIRHPSDVPIEISYAQQQSSQTSQLRNFSLNGACFSSPLPIEQGESVEIQLPEVESEPSRKLVGIVMWCCKKGDIFEVGVKFNEDDVALNASMLKKISRLESFKDDIKRREGRVLTGEETVAEFTAYMAKMHLKNID